MGSGTHNWSSLSMKKLAITLAIIAVAAFIGWRQFSAAPVARMVAR